MKIYNFKFGGEKLCQKISLLIGIGSFVYLRRIIESLIIEKYEQHSREIKETKKEFEILKFNEKIKVLQNYLPNILVESKEIYGIISKGLHELSEDECKKMFPFIKAGIESILYQDSYESATQERENIFREFVSKTNNELKK